MWLNYNSQSDFLAINFSLHKKKKINFCFEENCGSNSGIARWKSTSFTFVTRCQHFPPFPFSLWHSIPFSDFSGIHSSSFLTFWLTSSRFILIYFMSTIYIRVCCECFLQSSYLWIWIMRKYLTLYIFLWGRKNLFARINTHALNYTFYDE